MSRFIGQSIRATISSAATTGIGLVDHIHRFQSEPGPMCATTGGPGLCAAIRRMFT